MAHNDVAVFIDRDGTINVDVDFLSSPQQLQLIPRSADAIKELNDRKVPVFVITNQSGIARGLFSEKDLSEIHRALDEMLRQSGASVTGYYYCPHHPNDGLPPYVTDCDCRKPKPGLLHRAQKEHGLDLTRSFVIGDKKIDMEAGRSVGARTIHVGTGYGAAEKESAALFRDAFVPDLYDAVQLIKSQLDQ